MPIFENLNLKLESFVFGGSTGIVQLYTHSLRLMTNLKLCVKTLPLCACLTVPLIFPL